MSPSPLASATRNRSCSSIGRFVVRILRDELAADGEVEDGLAELLDVLGAGGEAREVAEVEAGVVAEGWPRPSAGWFRRCSEAADQPIAPALALRLRRLQPIAQRHQLVHLGDDAVLLGEGWEREHERTSLVCHVT